MKKIEKRRSLENLLQFGSYHASVARMLALTMKDAKDDESELFPIFNRLLAIHTYYFVEMAEVWTKVPTLVGGMDEWARMVKEEFGEDWSDMEKTRLDWLVSEYAKAAEAAGGDAPIGIPTFSENDEWSIVFDARDEDDDDDED